MEVERLSAAKTAAESTTKTEDGKTGEDVLPGDEEKMEVDGERVRTMTVERAPESSFHTTLNNFDIQVRGSGRVRDRVEEFNIQATQPFSQCMM